MMMDKLLPQSEIIVEEIYHSVEIDSPATEIYRCFSTAEGWNAWFTSEMSLDLRPGGRIIFQWKNWGAENLSTGDHGVILTVIQDRVIEFTWHPDRSDYTTIVKLTIEDTRKPCIVRVIESGFSNSPEGYHAMIQSAAGWGEALTLLKMYLEHGISLVVQDD